MGDGQDSCHVKVSGEWVELRREGGPNLGQSDAALMAYAAGMVTWARKNLHSTVSGRHMKPLQGGHARYPGSPPRASWHHSCFSLSVHSAVSDCSSRSYAFMSELSFLSLWLLHVMVSSSQVFTDCSVLIQIHHDHCEILWFSKGLLEDMTKILYKRHSHLPYFQSQSMGFLCLHENLLEQVCWGWTVYLPQNWSSCDYGNYLWGLDPTR